MSSPIDKYSIIKQSDNYCLLGTSANQYVFFNINSSEGILCLSGQSAVLLKGVWDKILFSRRVTDVITSCATDFFAVCKDQLEKDLMCFFDLCQKKGIISVLP